jgi:hypothetical protein
MSRIGGIRHKMQINIINSIRNIDGHHCNLLGSEIRGKVIDINLMNRL